MIAGLNISNAICNLFKCCVCCHGAMQLRIIIDSILVPSEFEKETFGRKASMVYGRSLSDPYGDPGSLLHGVSIIVRYHRGGTSLRTVVYYYHSSILSDTGVLNVFYFTLRSGGKTVITFFV